MQFVVVKQISFMLENHPGALHRAAAELARSGVNIHGISVLDKPDVGVVRLHTSDPLKAKTVLDLIGLKPTETDVIEIELPNQPGKLADVCRALTLAEVNVDYAYGSGSEPGRRMKFILKATPLKEAKRVLEGIAEE
jgi:ACT domain-containing protein